ncbi:MAG: putative Ig domain-containing protein, partial [Verrucomicrobiales bacterium]|nr:putative Ig domain-containing protein [Verrucomicrobiales bacterium]
TRGLYIFENVLPGDYYVRIPATEFAAGKPLAGTVSIDPASPTDDGQDDNVAGGDSGVNNAQPDVNGISSPLIALRNNGEVTGEAGFWGALDSADDNNGNMTVDFGFKTAPVSATGCYHFNVADLDHDAGHVLSQITEWTPDQPYDFTYDAAVAHVDNLDLIYDAALKRLVFDASFNQIGSSKVDAFWMTVSTGPDPLTADHAVLYFDGFDRAAPQITIYRYDTSAGETTWSAPAQIMVSSAAGGANASDVMLKQVTEVGSTVRFKFVVDLSHVNNAANWTSYGVNSATWEGMLFGTNAGIALNLVDLDGAPAYDASGKLSAFNHTAANGSFLTDAAGVETIVTETCPTSPWVSIGNLVWSDTNNNGAKDASELGLPGATVQLFSPGSDDAIGGSGSAADVQVGAGKVTTGTGSYLFDNLIPGKYFVKVTPPAGYPLTGGLPVTSDNRVDNDNNGSQPGGLNTVLISPVIDLQLGAEPTSDGDGANGDATVDFGLFSGITIGNLVFHDTGNNGVRDSAATDPGVSGASVALLTPGADGVIGGTGVNQDTVVATTSTNASGAYSFTVFTGGNYFVRVTPPATLPLASSGAVVADNGVDNDNNGVQSGAAGSAINSMVFNLTPGGEPGAAGSGNTENTIDFGVRPCPTINITPAGLGNATQYAVYSQTLTASGGANPYSWNITSGNLPAGMNLSPTGVLSGTPVGLPGDYTFNVRAVDGLGCVGTKSYTLTLLCPPIDIQPLTVPGAVQYSSYTQNFSATGGTAPYAWDVPSGVLPTGMTMSSGGVLGGTITGAPGTYNVTVRVTDAGGCVQTRDYAIVVACPALGIAQNSLPGVVQYEGYTQTLTASGGTAPYNWAVSGSLPTGLTLSPAGVISGTATGAPGTYNFTVTVTDAVACITSKSFAIQVSCPAISIAPTSLSNAIQYDPYTPVALTATAGTAPYSWTIVSGSLPAGMSLDSAGNLSGTPTALPGNFNFTVRALDAVGCVATRPYTLVVDCPPLTITPATLPDGVQYDSYSQALTVTGGTAPYAWSLTSGALPAGITLSPGGIISGTPTVIGSFNITLRVVDAGNCVGTQNYTLAISCPPITITPGVLPGAVQYSSFSQALSSSGGTAPYTWSIVSGALPTGITLSSGGLLSGTPTAAPGDFTFTVQSIDVFGCPATIGYTLTVACPAIAITPSTLPDGVVGSGYSRALTANGGTAPYLWSLENGTLPPGLSLSAGGVISGTPSSAVSASFTVKVADQNGCLNTRNYTLTTACPGILVTPNSLPNAYLTVNYNEQLTAVGGTGPYQWSIVSGGLPAGMSLSPSGVISGVPAAVGVAILTVEVQDAYGCSASRGYVLEAKGMAVGNVVFDDANFNGVRDAGESGVQGVLISLF